MRWSTSSAKATRASWTKASSGSAAAGRASPDAAGGLAVTAIGFALAATGFVRGQTPTLFALGESEHSAIRAELDARTCT